MRIEVVPPENWEPLFRSQGRNNPTRRVRMTDGFNEGWIKFESGESRSRRGQVSVKSVLRELIERERM
jgi:NAD(P)H dehydrogenase (quinone)